MKRGDIHVEGLYQGKSGEIRRLTKRFGSRVCFEVVANPCKNYLSNWGVGSKSNTSIDNFAVWATRRVPQEDVAAA